MFESLIVQWIQVNNWFNATPLVFWLLLLISYAAIKGIPWWWKQRKGILQAEEKAKKDSWESIQKIDRKTSETKQSVETLTGEFIKMNGSLKNHLSNYEVHHIHKGKGK